ncbi:hypothetical protein DFA_05509 [Cavenderia fasciculata]|uniref:N-acetyltransferase domain-containing protein n=1 Tax=Cavenderia fasciculata TaxID=261658 RepID=F4PLF5_CACFS|nr:uncharacterized protein DFA_05509 [Cavenderia fasciculata]EGG23377.1 hypothetical protein DFA_05509 [Cavenderia fasciculata]|eukprot:XP_004361228.1 hypothetical protein DFA_05509 [Cavenderia fasciculata]
MSSKQNSAPSTNTTTPSSSTSSTTTSTTSTTSTNEQKELKRNRSSHHHHGDEDKKVVKKKKVAGPLTIAEEDYIASAFLKVPQHRLSADIRRIKRKFLLRGLKRTSGLTTFDVDHAVQHSLSQIKRKDQRLTIYYERDDIPALPQKHLQSFLNPTDQSKMESLIHPPLHYTPLTPAQIKQQQQQQHNYQQYLLNQQQLHQQQQLQLQQQNNQLPLQTTPTTTTNSNNNVNTTMNRQPIQTTMPTSTSTPTTSSTNTTTTTTPDINSNVNNSNITNNTNTNTNLSQTKPIASLSPPPPPQPQLHNTVTNQIMANSTTETTATSVVTPSSSQSSLFKHYHWSNATVAAAAAAAAGNGNGQQLDSSIITNTIQSPICFKPFKLLSEKLLSKKRSFKTIQPYVSPHTTRELRAFIRRDFETAPPKLQVIRELHQFFAVNDMNTDSRDPLDHDVFPIDYKYLTPDLVDRTQTFLCENFWKGIELNDVLEYPDFTVCALYKSMVIGCGIMNPDGYIMFLSVHPEWQGTGIASFMLYHLTQTMIGKDITLHVSTSNQSALLLYQKFGFKIEEHISGFYDKYYSDDSDRSKNAFLLRLRRMSNPGVYADLVKTPSDLLKKEFPTTKQIEITDTIKGIPNTSVVGTVVQKENGNIQFSINPKTTLPGNLKNGKVSLTGDSNKFLKGEVTFDALAPGLKAVFTGDSNKIVQADFQYKKDNFALTTILKSNKKITGTATVGLGKISLGLQTIFDAKTNKIDDAELSLVFKKDGIIVGVSPKNKFQKLNITAFDKVSPRLAFAADLTVDLQSPDKNPAFTVGSQYFIDSKSFIKTKVNDSGRIGIGYTLPVNEYTKATVGFDINGDIIHHPSIGTSSSESLFSIAMYQEGAGTKKRERGYKHCTFVKRETDRQTERKSINQKIFSEQATTGIVSRQKGTAKDLSTFVGWITHCTESVGLYQPNQSKSSPAPRNLCTFTFMRLSTTAEIAALADDTRPALVLGPRYLFFGVVGFCHSWSSTRYLWVKREEGLFNYFQIVYFCTNTPLLLVPY